MSNAKHKPPTEWVVYCPAHREYLAHVSAGGTTWRTDQGQAKRFTTKPAAREAARQATWLEHNPTVWAVPVTRATL